MFTFVLSACNQATESANQATTAQMTQPNQRVQQVINDLGLDYVEERAQDIITYDIVNAAQQAWCDALVKIGQIKEEGGDYKAYAEQILSEAYN